MTAARLLTLAVWLAAGGAVVAPVSLVFAHVTGDWDRWSDAELAQLDERERANPSPRGDPVQNAAHGAAGVAGGCCLFSTAYYPLSAFLVIRGRRRLRRDASIQRVWSEDMPDWLTELIVVGCALLIVTFAVSTGLLVYATGNLMVLTGWLAAAVAVRWEQWAVP